MTRRYRLPFLITLALLCLALTACSSSKADTVLPPVTAEQLPEMLIAGDTIPAGGATLNADPSSLKASTEDEMFSNSFNPDDDRADLEQFGRQADFQKWYLRADAASPISYVSTGVTFYDTPAGASGDLVNDFEDMQNAVGATNARGAQLLSVQAFVVPSVGSRGMQITTILNGETSYITIVTFSRGQVVGGVGIASVDNRDLRGDATNIAYQLANQISTVLNYGITPTPTPSPTPVPSDTPAPSP